MRTMLVAVTALVVLVACGGGSMSGSNGTPASGLTQTVATSGTITAFGSVFVNGVRYDVSAASIRKNGRTVAQAALAVGEVALVRGRQNLDSGQGNADSVEVEDNVVGPIGSIDVVGSELVTLGQTVRVTAGTSFGKGITPADLTGLMAGDPIEVSGLTDAGGVIVASRIARAEANEPMQVLGAIAGLNATAHTFMINGLKVDFTAATVAGFAAGHPADGDTVVARGTSFDAATVMLSANALQPAGTDPRESADGQHAETGQVEIEGLISNFVSATEFEVAGAKVTTTSTTTFKGGSAADLADQTKVEVEGTLDANQVLVADTIEIDHVAAIELESTASQVDLTNNTLMVLGVTVTVDANTRFEDKSSAQLQMFKINDIADGDTVLVRGYESPAGSGRVLARKLERLPASADVVVRGPFMATTAPQFMIVGITIDATNADFGQVEEQGSMSAADFFARAVGQIVEVRGAAAGGTVTATKVRIDSEEDR